jgi:hypothetical protein
MERPCPAAKKPSEAWAGQFIRASAVLCTRYSPAQPEPPGMRTDGGGRRNRQKKMQTDAVHTCMHTHIHKPGTKLWTPRTQHMAKVVPSHPHCVLCSGFSKCGQ